MYEEEIRKLLTSKKFIVGEEEVLKNVRKNALAKVYVASNAKKELLKDLQKYSGLSGFQVVDTAVPNDELGTICKKPFSISIIGVLK